ncbi:hypothetical protein AB0D45_33870 [Streptomyces sp. NPDC048352]
MSQIPVDSSGDGQRKTVAETIAPSTDLLDRAQAGCERFLSTFEAACDE